MNIPKRVVLSATAIAALAIAGCTGTSAPAPAEGEIGGDLSVVFDSNYKASLEPVVAEFEDRYPDVNLTVDYAGGDIPGTVSTQLQAGTAPDIFLTYPGGTPGSGGGMNNITLGSQELVVDLSDSSWADDVPEPWNADVEWDGGVWAYPGALQGLGPNYNLTALDENDFEIPTTWDDVLQLCADARDAGIVAYAAGFNDAANMIYLALSSTLVYGPDADWDQQLLDGETSFEDSAWVDVFEYVVEMNDAGCFQDGALGTTRAQSGELVASGQALGVIDVGASLAVLEGLNPDNDYALAPLPTSNDPEDTHIVALPGYTISINAASKNIPAAKAFLEVLNENRGVYSAGFASLPVITLDGFEPDAGLVQFNEALTAGKSTRLPNWPAAGMQELLMAEVQALLLGQSTVDQVLQKAQDEYDRG
jgi:raffinose/stachyose/melibiose transport system substrate-binding protein